MARCGCGGVVDGVSVGVSDCVAMSGAGTPGDPFVPVLLLSADADNAAECRDDGLYVANAVTVFDFAERSSGNLTLNSTAWTNLDTGLDLVLDAVAGDVIEVGGTWRFQGEAVEARLDVASLVAAAPVNYWSNGTATPATNGIIGFGGPASIASTSGGSMMRACVAGDLSLGTLTLRLRYKTDAATNKTLLAATTERFYWWAKNLGPA